MRRIIALALVVGLVFLGRERLSELPSATWKSFQDGIDNVTGKTAVDLGQRAKRALREETLRRAFDQFEAAKGAVPDDIQDLWDEGLLQQAELVDEWGRSLQVEANAEGIVVRSAGPDGRFHTRDDWTVGD